MMKEGQKNNPRFRILFIGLLALAIGYSTPALTQEAAPLLDEAEIQMEKEIIQEVEKKKEAQLKEYFRDYYYKQGLVSYKKGRYQEAMAKFKRALYWAPEYEPAIKYIALTEDRINQQRRLEEEKKLAEARRKEAQEKAERLRAQEVMPTEIPETAIIYRIDKEDVLETSVWRHPELSREVIVRPDGMISFPLVGDIQASGLTVAELDEKITQGLSEFAKRRFKPSISEDAEERAEYLIGAGDTLDISVWKEPDLSREIIVRPDGKISFPLVGDMQAVGKTLTQLDEELTQSLSSYVKEPQVSVMVMSFGWKKEMPAEVFLEESPEVFVMIKKFGGKKVVVLGDVAKPGVYTYTGDIRLIEALALAGDCTKFAVKNNILIIRGDIHSNPTVISSNMLAFLKNAKLSENVLIQSQDVVFVPRSLIGNINAFIETITPMVDMIYKGSYTKATIDDF